MRNSIVFSDWSKYGGKVKLMGPIKMPLESSGGHVENFDMYYTELNGKRYVIAMLGDVRSKAVLLRIESACIFGHVFGSAKCDCGYQLSKSIEMVTQKKRGIIIFAVDDDARGLGMKVHFYIYVLRQQHNMETPALYKKLGTEFDVRDYGDIITILKKFDIKAVELITNNTSRIEFLKKHGIAVVKRIPIETKISKYNEDLLLNERYYLGYKTSYKTHDYWAKELFGKIGEKRYGYLITKDYKNIISKYSGMNREIPLKMAIGRQVQGFISVYLNFGLTNSEIQMLSDAGVNKIVMCSYVDKKNRQVGKYNLRMIDVPGKNLKR